MELLLHAAVYMETHLKLEGESNHFSEAEFMSNAYFLYLRSSSMA